MAAVAGCPYKSVKQREIVSHEHRYLVETKVSDGSWLQDCACGDRRRVLKGEYNEIAEVFADGLVSGGGSMGNAIFFSDPPETNQFVDRWSS